MENNSLSLWNKYAETVNYRALEDNLSVEVLIVGAGIVGLTCAHLLQSAGHKCIVIDRNKVFGITSPRTTAKISSQHSLIYHNLIRQQGDEKAKMYLDSNERAIKGIQNLCNEYKIECDYINTPSYVFAQNKSSIENIERETNAVQSLGLKATYIDSVNLPIENYASICFPNQAQFNPVKYMNSLAKLFVANKGYIYEDTHAVKVDWHNDYSRVYTNSEQHITAQHVVIATQFPFYDGLGLYFTRLFGERSYISAIKTDNKVEGMYISAEEPIISLRNYNDSNNNYILIGGSNHKVGANISNTKCYNDLMNRAHKLYEVQEKVSSWSAQDYNTSDNIPFIGRLTKNYPNIYVATGFGKWGMTNSFISATIIKDLIEERDNPYISLYNPSRVHLDLNTTKSYIVENARVAKELIKGKLKKSDDFVEIDKGQGKVINYDNKRYGVYRDNNDKIYIVDNTCTHLGCELVFNDAEKTWDCPCHASRFSYDGSIIEGVAKRGLYRYDEIAEKIEID